MRRKFTDKNIEEMKAGNDAILMICSHEGLRLKAYRCPAGKLTIGYGHTESVVPGMIITKEKAVELLEKDVAICEDCLNGLELDLNQRQFDSLVDFIFNVGTGNFLSSTLLKKIKANPDDRSIAAEFRRWIYSNGRILPGLVNRRAAEVKLYFS